MKPELVAELRRVHPAGHSFERSLRDDDECVICGLLDELETCRKGYQMWGDAEAKCNAELEAMKVQLQEAEAENEGLRRDLGRVAPTEYRCLKAKGWLCGLGYGHTGSCMAVNHPHPLGGD